MTAGRSARELWKGLQTAFADKRVRALMTLTFVLIGSASVFYWMVERWSFLDSVYFSVITIATVGYGDLTPQTALGKIFTIGYILCGLGLFLAAATSVADSIINAQRDTQD